MTIQEQLIKLNGLFKKLHNDFASLSTEKNNLDAKYNTLVGALDNKYQSERDRINDQKEEVLKYYRIAKDNSNKELIDHGVALQTPNLAILNNMIEKVNSYSRTDPIAGQIIDLCNGYIAYYNNELGKVDLRKNTEINSLQTQKKQETEGIVVKQKRIFSECEAYLKGEEVKTLVQLFEMIHREYEITSAYFDDWGKVKKRKRMMLIGFSKYPVDVPQRFSGLLKNSLNKHFDEQTKMVNCPCGFTTDSHEEIYVEYTDFNEGQVKKGVQALILNFFRYFAPSEYKVTVLDYLHYNADVIGCLYPLSMMKNGLIDSIAQDEKSLKNNILLLASYYRKVESKLGGMSVYDYNKSHSQSDRIPYRLIIINRKQESFSSSQEAEMSYLVNNAAKLGITLIVMNKSNDGGSKGKDREKKYLAKAKDYIRIISDAKGNLYIENDVEWLPFKWLDAPDYLPDDFVKNIENMVKPVQLGTEYFKRFKATVPTRSVGKRKPVMIPFAINEDDKIINCSFENELFAEYINGAAGSGKSTLLHTIICGLIMNYHPDELELWLLDFKMTELKKYEIHRPPHIKYLLLEKSEDLVFDILDKLDDEMARRKFVFSQNGWHKLSDVPPNIYMPVIFVIIDEFAQMSQILKDTKGSGVGSDYAMKLENILREGRAVGFKFIFSSQTYSDGVEGLTESARKQIQQRLAMKNTYLEIKDTLALTSDVITPEIQTIMNTLPPFESIFKWRTETGKVRVDHLRNMFTKDSEVDDVCDGLRKNFHTTASITSENNTYVEKHPVLIDGSTPKTFKSQIDNYKRYETDDVLDELDDEDILIYPGVPCSFNLAQPFTLINGTAENILVAGGDRENELSIMLSVFNSYSRKHYPIEIWANDRNSIYKKYKSTVFKKFNVITDLEDICNRVDKIKNSIRTRAYDNRLIVVLGYETLISDLELMSDMIDDENNDFTPTVDVPEDMSQIMEKIKACDDLEEKKRILADYNARVAEYEAQMASAKPVKTGRGIYDARDDIEWIVKRASAFGVHFMFAFERAKDFIDTKLDERAFRHKIAFAMSRDESTEVVGNRKANEIGAGVCLYSNGKDTYTMHPHIYYGVPSNGWEVNDKGQVIQKGK